MNDLERKLAAARTRLILDKPFLGALVLRLPLRESTENWCATTATDARAFYYNADYLSLLTISQIQFVLAHEALHCGLSHFARREHRNRHRWDVACDHAVNQMLIEDGLKPPADALVNESFAGMTAEEIYPFILSDTDEKPMDQHLYDGDNPGDQQPDQQPDNQSGSAEQESTVTEQVEQNRQPPPALTAQQRDELHTQWQQRLVGAAQQAVQAGKMSAGIARLVNRLLHSSIPWRTVLARFMSDSTRTDYNLMRPSQRRSGDAIQPSLHTPMTNVVVAVDTSGSIDENELDSFVTEVNAIKGLVNARITLLACDSELDPEGPWIFEPWEKLVLPKKLHGQKGTDFNPVFDWLQFQSHLQNLVIYFTDANGRFPETPPPIETLWLVKGSAEIPWGQRIQLN